MRRAEPRSARADAPGAWLAAALLAALACAPEPDPLPGPAPPAEGFPREVRGADGVLVQLASPPVRVLPTNAAAVDLVLALVPPERVVALPETVFEFANAALDAEGWGERPLFTGYTGEGVLAHGPDLVLTHAWQKPATTTLLRENGVAVLSIAEPDSREDLWRTLRLGGQALGAEARAEELVAELEERLDAATGAGRRAGLRALSYTNFGTGGWVAGRGTSGELLFELAGIRNLAVEAGFEGHARIDAETLLTLDPDLIVVGTSQGAPGTSASADYLRAEPALAGLRAVREGRIAVLPARLFQTTSHHLVDAVEALHAAIDGLDASPPR